MGDHLSKCPTCGETYATEAQDDECPHEWTAEVVHAMRLPFGETDGRKRYSMPDPDALDGGHASLYREVYYHQPPVGKKVVVSEAYLKQVLSLAKGYLFLTTYELGQEVCVAKLRDIWRARRARARGEGEEG